MSTLLGSLEEPRTRKTFGLCREGHPFFIVVFYVIFKEHIDRAVEELGAGYEVTLQGRFDKTPLRLEIEITSSQGEIP